MKRLITCSDGTWDKPGDVQGGVSLDSNVCLLFNAIAPVDDQGVRQLKVYDTGIGTGFSAKDKILGGATGLGIDKKIKDIYTFLLLNYQIGDEIYLFGFSRGAYTARSLVGFIRNCGILKPEYIHLVNTAYELYRERNDYTKPDSDLMVSFRENYCRENITQIKLIGVWDTVGSLGIPLPWYKFNNMRRYKFHDVTLSSTVDNAFHALAVDERRTLFQPTLWEMSEKVKNGSKKQNMEQRWFCGVHANVGGGYEDRGLSDLTLDWIIKKAEGVGLKFDPNKISSIKPNPLGVLRNSYTIGYWFWRPIWRAIKKKRFDANQQLLPTNEEIDDSVRIRMTSIKKYKPGSMNGI